jgi:hypothetical protein
VSAAGVSAEHLPSARPVRSLLRHARWRKAVKRVLLAVGVAWVFYLAVANAVLRTRLLRDAVSGGFVNFAVSGAVADLRLDYASAYSLLPGRAHVDGLSIRGRDRAVEWFLTLERADVHISLRDVLRRNFHATRVRASGFTIRARLRLARPDAIPEVVAALPPIKGFADPPLLDEGPGPPALTDEEYRLWAIDLEDVDVEHVREVWIQGVRAVGDTHVAGRWIFRPQRWLDVGPATVDANGVDFSYGSHLLAGDVRGSFGATVHPFDLRQADGLKTLDYVSYDGRLRGRALLAGALHALVPRSRLSLVRCEGPFDARVILDHGRLVKETRVWSEATGCAMEADGLVLKARMRTQLGVDQNLGTLDTRVSDLRVSRAGVERARVDGMSVVLTSLQLQVAHLGGDARFTVDVGGVRTDDLGGWQSYLPSTSILVVQSGTGTAEGHAEGSVVDKGGWAVGNATIAADDVTVALGPAVVAGNLAARVALRRGTWTDRRVDLSGSEVLLGGVSARSTRSGVVMLAVPALTAVAPSLVLTSSSVEGYLSIDLPRGDLVHLDRLHEWVSLPRGVDVESGGGRAKLHGDVELGTGVVRGDGEIALRGVRARVGSTALFGDLDCTLKARRAGGAGGATTLSGTTFAITHAGTGSAPRLEDTWWANGGLRGATLRTEGGLHLDARVHVVAKDASPATALVSQNTAVPAWAADIFRMPILDADAEVRVAPSSFEVRSLLAHGANASVRAEYTKHDGRQDGAALLDLGWIDLGYDLADGSTGLVLAGPDAWFGHKVAALRDAATTAKRTSDTAEQIARYAAMTPALRLNEARLLAARCALEVRTCDGSSIDSLLLAAGAGERGVLGAAIYAPMVVAAAMGGKDGTTLDPAVVGSVAEAMRTGGPSTLDDIAPVSCVAAVNDPNTARGKVIVVAGRISSIVRREGPTAVGTLTTEAAPIYFVTPFATSAVPESLALFRGVFVQRYEPADLSQGAPSLVLVGAFGS